MTEHEYLTWHESEPDTFELRGSVPVRVPDEEQGGRRIGKLFFAAWLSLGNDRLRWLLSPLEGGLRPIEVASQSWTGLEDLLLQLPQPETDFPLCGEAFSRISLQVRSLARIERRRHAIMLASQMSGEHQGRYFIESPHPLFAGRTPGEVAAEGYSGLRDVIDLLIRQRE